MLIRFGIRIDDMSAGERTEFREWYDRQRSVLFINRRVLETYYQEDVTVLRQACRVFRREFLQVGNTDVFHESSENSWTVGE